MFRFKPSHKMFAIFLLDPAETDERPHLVNVPPHSFCHDIELAQQRISAVAHVPLARFQVDEKLVEQSKSLRIIVADDRTR